VSPEVRILVVDDNTVNLTVALGFLARHGVAAETAKSGKEAIEKIRAVRYDLVLMDHLMPGMDGIEAVLRIRALRGDYYQNVPVIALSANAVTGMREAFLSAGMNDFISKPIDGAELNTALIRWLPPEKILPDGGPTAQTSRNQEESSDLDNTLLLLEKIDDLDVGTGLARTNGNKLTYVNILGLFCREMDKDIADIKALLEQRAWRDYTVRLHTLKSIFANCGNQRMSDWASRLEQASADGDTETCLQQTRSFCSSMEEFRIQVSAILLTAPLDTAPRTAVDAHALTVKLKTLQQACFAFRTSEAALLAEGLQRVTCSRPEDADALLREICELVHAFEYPDAADKCEILLSMLSGQDT
jgi:CheY-like chemotaxis protein